MRSVRFDRRTAETTGTSPAYVDLGAVTAPSETPVLGMAGWIDHWPEAGRPLSERAADAAARGGGHLYGPEEGERPPANCEAIAVPAATDRPLRVRTSPPPFDGEPAISLLEVDLGLPWPEGEDGGPVPLGDPPVDRCGMVLGDARALDSFVGMDGEAVDGLADRTYRGRYEEETHAALGGERVVNTSRGSGPYGWLDLPLSEARATAERLRAWNRTGPGKGNGLMTDVGHTDHQRLRRAGWTRPLLNGIVDIAGCPVLGLHGVPGDHSVRHHGERAWGRVHPATLAPREGRTVLRWTVPPAAWPPGGS
ncbi:hypothetical protein ACF05T_22005 [Streptomyces lateritius]|uniref:Uncharacterized protein n=1 Tax=Streptomyces lateritius TaxID=67313 RepID=A0ABW6YG04_9ACTN